MGAISNILYVVFPRFLWVLVGLISDLVAFFVNSFWVFVCLGGV